MSNPDWREDEYIREHEVSVAEDDLVDEGLHEAAMLPPGACSSCLGTGDCPRCTDAVVLLGPCAACDGDGACSVCGGTGQGDHGPGDTRA